MIEFKDAGVLIKLLADGKNLAATLAYDIEHAKSSACLLLAQHPQFDSVVLCPYLDAPEPALQSINDL
ncbi:hypothetical protein KDA_77180 [Dictyobacter alpinus]|uniref:Uncharacterized protein n=1 Tax=Dictyobacter alpinus TaxID=2014873 RepID=A0A402BLL2_9CHLR|nr:hypothetical protein [Dictyobacter alpinus]GCE32234.1 hypothetical protein KDA_77180 [Dictyobacter alpinus]